MDSKFTGFIKRNYKFLSIIVLLLAIIVVLCTQISFKKPETVVSESKHLVESINEQDTEEEPIESEFEQRLESEDSEDSQPIQSNNQPNGKTDKVNTEEKKVVEGKLDINFNFNGTGESGDKASISPTKAASKRQLADENSSERVKLTDYIGGSWAYANKGGRYIYLINQKVDKSSPISVNVTVECKEILEDGVECNDSAAWKYVPKNGYIVPTTKVTCYSGENAWDAIARVLNANSIDYAYTGDPPFIHGTESVSSVYGTCYLYRCNHLEAGNASENKSGPFGNSYSGWTFTINGVYPGLGMNGTIIREGDDIVLKYYTGYNPFTMDEKGEF